MNTPLLLKPIHHLHLRVASASCTCRKVIIAVSQNFLHSFLSWPPLQIEKRRIIGPTDLLVHMSHIFMVLFGSDIAHIIQSLILECSCYVPNVKLDLKKIHQFVCRVSY